MYFTWGLTFAISQILVLLLYKDAPHFASAAHFKEQINELPTLVSTFSIWFQESLLTPICFRDLYLDISGHSDFFWHWCWWLQRKEWSRWHSWWKHIYLYWQQTVLILMNNKTKTVLQYSFFLSILKSKFCKKYNWKKIFVIQAFHWQGTHQ